MFFSLYSKLKRGFDYCSTYFLVWKISNISKNAGKNIVLAARN
jgi:hypothetical protein